LDGQPATNRKAFKKWLTALTFTRAREIPEIKKLQALAETLPDFKDFPEAPNQENYYDMQASPEFVAHHKKLIAILVQMLNDAEK